MSDRPPATGLAAVLRRWRSEWSDRPVAAHLAVSGGPDSMALLHAWEMLRSTTGDVLSVGHVDHGWRADSRSDADFVADWCAARGLSCFVNQPVMLVPGLGSREETARQFRYRCLETWARSVGADIIACGHTADDQAETVLHAILRGTGLRGLAGMRSTRCFGGQVSVVRPLLTVTRADVLAYLSKHAVRYRCDPTNDDRSLTRNRIRHELLPLIASSGFPQVSASLQRLAEIAAEVGEMVAAATEDLERDLGEIMVETNDMQESIVMPLAPLRRARRPVRIEFFTRLWDRRQWPRKPVAMHHWNQLNEVIDGTCRGAELPGGIRAERRRTPMRSLVLTRYHPSGGS